MTDFSVGAPEEAASRRPGLTNVVRRAIPMPRRRVASWRPAALVAEVVVMSVVAIVTAMLVPPLGDIGRLAVTLVLLTFVAQVAMLPVYERLRSQLPLRRSAVVGALVLLASATINATPARQLRATAIVVGATLLAALVVRIARSRAKTRSVILLVGDRVAISHLVS